MANLYTIMRSLFGNRKFYTFDDIGIIPRFNSIPSRLSTDITCRLGETVYRTPFVPANMDTVIGEELATVCRNRGAPIIFHRFAPIDQKISWLREFPGSYASLGVNEESDNHFEALYENGCRHFCIDIAHGHSVSMIQMIKRLLERDSKMSIIAGNVCTADGVVDLARAGAKIIKVGVGPGAACTTRMMTGFGIPQFSAVHMCAEAKEFLRSEGGGAIDIQIIADGGIKHPRDAVLAIAAGADVVMMGSIFARTIEAAGHKYESGGKVYGKYRGQASAEFMKDYYGGEKKRIAEGVAFDVEITKSAYDVFDIYEGGLRSALTYNGSDTITDFQHSAEFFVSTPSYMIESNYRIT